MEKMILVAVGSGDCSEFSPFQGETGITVVTDNIQTIHDAHRHGGAEYIAIVFVGDIWEEAKEFLRSRVRLKR